MINLLRAEFQRLVKSKSFIAAPIIAVAFILLNVIVIKASVPSGEIPAELLSMIAGAREIIFNAPAFGDATFIIILFTALFVASDFKSGTIKNTAVCGAPRPQIYLSRLITVFAFGVGIILLCVISGTVLGYAFFPDSPLFSPADFGNFVRGVFVYIWVMAALASLCTCLSFLSRSTGSAVTISLLVYFLFNLVVQMLSVFTETDLSLYTLSGVNGMASFYGGYTAGEILSIIFIPLVLTAAANAIGILSFEKRDIK